MRDPKVFSDSYQFTISIFHRTKSFPRALRPTLGRRMEDHVLELTQALRKALLYPVKNDARSSGGPSPRLRLLRTASDHLDDLRVLMDLSRDLKILTHDASEELAKLSREIGREIGGLIKRAS